MLLLLPWIVPTVVSAFAWNWMVATPQSPVPAAFDVFGLGAPLFLTDPVLAQVVVCLYKVWTSFPFMMTVMVAALAGIDTNVYEAAKVDGADAWQSFRLITLPLVMRPIYIAWVLMAIFCVNDFATIALLTNGGPYGATTTLVVLAYQTVFQNFAAGQGVAVAFLTTLVLIVVAVLLHRRIGKAHAE